MHVETPAELGGPTIKEATDAVLAKCQNLGIRRTTLPSTALLSVS